jgi:pilus assembly protein CpaB
MMFLRPPFRLDRSTVLLIAAVATGLVAAAAARHYLRDRAAAIEAGARTATVPVVVAKADLPRGTALSAETLAVREVPQAWVQSGAVQPVQFDRVVGDRLAHPLRSGEMLMWSQIEVRRTPTFSARVEAGRRAVTVPVDEISSISGLLEPGDRIDLLVTLDRVGRRQTVTVLQDVSVLATGQRADEEPRGGGDRRLYTTVTLDTDPAQARNLVLARESGRLTALLRSPGDRSPAGPVVDDLAVWLAGDAPAMRSPGGAAGAPASRVLVLYGGRGAPPPVDSALPGRPAAGGPPAVAGSGSGPVHPSAAVGDPPAGGGMPGVTAWPGGPVAPPPPTVAAGPGLR